MIHKKIAVIGLVTFGWLANAGIGNLIPKPVVVPKDMLRQLSLYDSCCLVYYQQRDKGVNGRFVFVVEDENKGTRNFVFAGKGLKEVFPMKTLPKQNFTVIPMPVKTGDSYHLVQKDQIQQTKDTWTTPKIVNQKFNGNCFFGQCQTTKRIV